MRAAIAVGVLLSTRIAAAQNASSEDITPASPDPNAQAAQGTAGAKPQAPLASWYLPAEADAYKPKPPPPPPPPEPQTVLGVQMFTHIFAGGPVKGTATEFDVHADWRWVGVNLGILGVNGGLATLSADFFRRAGIEVYKAPSNISVQVLFPVPELKFVLGADNDFVVPSAVLTGIRVVRCPFVAELRLPSIEAWVPIQADGSSHSLNVPVATGGGLTVGLIL